MQTYNVIRTEAAHDDENIDDFSEDDSPIFVLVLCYVRIELVSQYARKGVRDNVPFYGTPENTRIQTTQCDAVLGPVVHGLTVDGQYRCV